MRSRVFALLVSLVLSACMAAPGASLASSQGSTPGSSAAPTATNPTVVPTIVPTAPPTPTPSHEAKPTPSPVVTPSPPEPTPTPTATVKPHRWPPQASVVLADGTRIIGQLGSWCYGNRGSCSDTPAFPIERLPKVNVAEAGAPLEIVLSRPELVTSWRAAYTRSIVDEGYGVTLGSGGDPDASTVESETASFAFAGPPTGSWFLMLDLTFAPWGDAFYSWHAVVGD